MNEQIGVEIPWTVLSPEALQGVIDDFILREGTDYGWHETALERKREAILRQLKNRTARIYFDPVEDSITLHPSP